MMQVNTLIIGAGRSGTTTLSKLMESHPQICFSSIKEVHYFSIADLYSRGESYFHSFFSKCNDRKIIAMADTYLLPVYDAISRIKQYNPGMKIIVILRHPVDRAYSSYNYSVNYGYHKKYDRFTDSIEIEKNIVKEPDIVKLNNLGHFYCSLYYKHLKRWTSELKLENFLFLTTDELKNTPESLLMKLADFLEIEQFKNSEESTIRHNANAIPKNKMLEQFMLNRENPVRKIIRNIFPRSLKNAIINSGIADKIHSLNRKESSYEPLTPKERNKASAFFKEDLQKLNEEFGIKLQ